MTRYVLNKKTFEMFSEDLTKSKSVETNDYKEQSYL